MIHPCYSRRSRESRRLKCVVLRQISEVIVKHQFLLCHLTWCTHHILGWQQWSGCALRAICVPGISEFGVTMYCWQDDNPVCNVSSLACQVCLCWHSLDPSVSLAYWQDSPETSRTFMHGADSCMSAHGKAEFIVWTLHWFCHNGIWIAAGFGQDGNVRNCLWDCRCVSALHVKMSLRSSSTEKIRARNFCKRKQEWKVSVTYLLCWLHSQKVK